MKLQQIGVTNQQANKVAYDKNYATKSDVNFGRYHNFNIGGGSARGTIGLSHNNRIKAKEIITLNTPGEFLPKLAAYIARSIGRDKKPQILIGTTGAVGNDSVNISNIFAKDGNMVGTITFADLAKAIKAKLPGAKVEVKITNDGAPQAFSDLLNAKVRRVVDRAGLGKPVYAKFGGGGHGVYTSTKIKGGYLEKTTQDGHSAAAKPYNETLLRPFIKEGSVPSTELAAISSKSSARNVATALGYGSEDAERIGLTAEGRITTDLIVRLNRNDTEQLSQANALRKLSLGCEELEGKPLFKHAKDGDYDNFVLIDPKTNEAVTQEAFDNASKIALEEYFRQLAMLARDSINHSGSSTIVVTSSLDRHFAKAANKLGLNVNEIVSKTAYENLAPAMQASLRPQDIKVKFIKTGDPGRGIVARVPFASEPYGPTMTFVPNSAFAKKSKKK